MAWKIFAGVLGALLAFWMIVTFFFGVAVWGAGKAAEEEARQSNQASQQWLATQRREQESQRQAALDRQMFEVSRHRLASNQRCVGGTVITVNGSVYTQVAGSSGRPVSCSGDVAQEPLR